MRMAVAKSGRGCVAVCLALAFTLFASTLHAGSVRMGAVQPGTALVADPAAPDGRCTAIRIGDANGSASLEFDWIDPVPGLYRVVLPLRFYAKSGFGENSVKLDVAFSGEAGTWLQYPLSPARLDGSPATWTMFAQPVVVNAPTGKNHLRVSWSFATPKSGTKQKASAKTVKPELFDSDGPAVAKQDSDIFNAISADSYTPLAQIEYPALLIGVPLMEPVNLSFVVEKVWPEKVHVYPGGTNPVEVTVRNFTGKDADALVVLEMKSGLDEAAKVGEEKVQIPARGTARIKFPWVAGRREFGHAAVATLSVGGIPVHSNAEYFSVSAPVWKTAIQGNGFLSWYGREQQFEKHVAENRRAYINVEEAFSWQPSSWNDLNPTNETWWTGQNGFHNSLSGLKEWISRSHADGIKMITYSWPTISGKSGFDWGRRYPDILCREKSGVAPNIDLEDLALYDLVQDRPELWTLRSANWLSNWINLGLLRAIDHHAREVIRSARNFGWDGIRFDSPPQWSPMGTVDVHREFELLGVKDLMKQLLPEYYDSTNNAWSGDAISTRNVRYFRHVFTTELGANFAVSCNTIGLEEVETNKTWWYREMSRGGGQLMNEAIRNSSSISNYMNVVWWTAEKAREAGGYSCVFRAENCQSPLANIYSAVFTFASGAHPYLDYGWLGPMPGEYTKFMTRFGEYCWDPAFAPAGPGHAGVLVDSNHPLLWERYVRVRQSGGLRQTVVHLIAAPAWGQDTAPKHQVAWAHSIKVSKPCRSEPDVWLLSAEPELTAVRLPVEHRDGRYVVTVPEMHFWSMVVWSEKP